MVPPSLSLDTNTGHCQKRSDNNLDINTDTYLSVNFITYINNVTQSHHFKVSTMMVYRT